MECLANGYPYSTAYRVVMWCILVGLDKYHGVQPLCIGNFSRRLVCKVMLIVVANDATRACDTDQFCSALEVKERGDSSLVG